MSDPISKFSNTDERALELIDLQAIQERRSVDASTLIDCIKHDVKQSQADRSPYHFEVYSTQPKADLR